MKARGNTRKILKNVEEVEKMIGLAKSLHDNDRDPQAHSKAQQALEKALELCYETRSLYDPL